MIWYDQRSNILLSLQRLQNDPSHKLVLFIMQISRKALEPKLIAPISSVPPHTRHNAFWPQHQEFFTLSEDKTHSQIKQWLPTHSALQKKHPIQIHSKQHIETIQQPKERYRHYSQSNCIKHQVGKVSNNEIKKNILINKQYVVTPNNEKERANTTQITFQKQQLQFNSNPIQANPLRPSLHMPSNPQTKMKPHIEPLKHYNPQIGISTKYQGLMSPIAYNDTHIQKQLISSQLPIQTNSSIKISPQENQVSQNVKPKSYTLHGNTTFRNRLPGVQQNIDKRHQNELNLCLDSTLRINQNTGQTTKINSAKKDTRKTPNNYSHNTQSNGENFSNKKIIYGNYITHQIPKNQQKESQDMGETFLHSELKNVQNGQQNCRQDSQRWLETDIGNQGARNYTFQDLEHAKKQENSRFDQKGKYNNKLSCAENVSFQVDESALHPQEALKKMLASDFFKDKSKLLIDEIFKNETDRVLFQFNSNISQAHPEYYLS